MSEERVMDESTKEFVLYVINRYGCHKCGKQGCFTLLSDTGTFCTVSNRTRFDSKCFMVKAKCNCECNHQLKEWYFVSNNPEMWIKEDVQEIADKIKMKRETFEAWCHKIHKKMCELCSN